MQAGPILAVERLRVEFPTRRGTLVAVHDVSFEIARGEVLGVVGESGAGKSITGAAIIGLIDPPGRIAGGEIRLDGRRIDNLPPGQMRKVRGREIGAVFQDPLTSLNPLYTVGRQLVETIRTHLPLGDQQKHAFENYTPNNDQEHIAQCRSDTEDIQALKQGLLKLAVATCGRPGNHAADLRAQRNIQQREQR